MAGAGSSSRNPHDESMAVAGDPVFFKFNEIDMPNVFVCRQCEAHLSPTQEFLHRYLAHNNKQYGLFTNLANVVPADPRLYLSIAQTKAVPTLCVNCKSVLGCRYVTIELKETPVIKSGTFLVYMNKEMMDPEKEELLNQTVSEEIKHQAEFMFNALMEK